MDRGPKAVSDLESLHNAYGKDLPLDDTSMPEEIVKMREREILKKRILLLILVLFSLYLCYKIVHYLPPSVLINLSGPELHINVFV